MNQKDNWVSLILLCLLFGSSILSCNQQQKPSEPIEKVNPLIESFRESTHPGDEKFQREFKKNYQRYLTHKQYDSCGKILVAVGNALYANSMSDTMFLRYSMAYFEKYDLPQNNIIHHALANMVACHYTASGNLDSAKHWFRKAMNAEGDKLMQKSNAFACSEMGTIFLSNSRLDSAENYYLKAIHSFENLKDTQNLIVNYITLSTVFQGLHEWNMAEQYVDKSSGLARNSKDTDLIISVFQMKAYIKNTGLQDTLGFFKLVDSCDQLYQQYSHPNLYLQFVQNTILFDRSICKNELAYAGRFLTMSDSLNTIMKNDGIALQIKYMRCLYMASLNQMTQQKDEVLHLTNELEATNQYVMPFNLFDVLAKSASAKKDWNLALFYTNEKNRCKDYLFNQNKKGQLLEFEKKYQTEKKEKQILTQKAQLSNSKFQILGLLASLLTFALSSLLFFVYKKRKQAKVDFEKQEKFTNDLLENTEDERKRIASELHDSVNHELLTLKNEAIVGKLITSESISKVIEEVRNVSRDLYPAMFDHIGLAASIEALCERLTSAGLFTTCEIDYTNKLSKRNELQLYRIIQEALNNTLKHAKANAAKVTIETKDNELWVEIKDNGIGFDSTEKMNNAKSFGLQSLYQRARAMGGKSSLESNESGTKLILTTPLH